MGILYNRLLIILNEEKQDSTYHHIALIMLQNIENLQDFSINTLAELCAVSKSTISKFIRYIGYEDFADFRYAAILRDNKYQYSFNYTTNVMEFIEKTSLDTYLLTIQQDIAATYQNLDWNSIDQLVKDLAHYKKVGAFGLMFSETAAQDFQTKLCYQKKFIVTNLNDTKQDYFIENADEDTLIIVFSDSGEFLNKYAHISDFSNKQTFSKTKAKVVVITSNPEVEKDPRVSYCVRYQKTRSMTTHRVVYGILTDIIVFKYRQYIKTLKNNQE